MSELKWASLHCHSEDSVLDGFGKAEDIAKRCKELGHVASALTDHGTIAGLPNFHAACKNQGIKPILGCEFYFTGKGAKLQDSTNKSLNHVVILSKNLDGWYELIRCISESNKPENMYYKPRIDYEIMERFLGNGNHICITGHPGTELSGALFDDNLFYRCKSVKEGKNYLYTNWRERAWDVIKRHQDIFGDNLFIEIQTIDHKNLPASLVIAECLREIVRESGGKLRPVGTADSHYVMKEDAEFQRILLCSALGRTMPSVHKDLRAGKDVPLGTFFISDNYHIPSLDELKLCNTEEEISNAALIADMCEEYDITGPPQLPHFDCDGGDEYEYLRKLAHKGWKEKLVNQGVIDTEERKNVYLERIKKELGVIKEEGLSGYFLIVQDIIDFCRKKKWLPLSPGRGSAAGCLISYLIGITTIDPIPYDLIFERFFNAARKGSLPDIDIDVPAEHREEVIQYIKDKYGEKYVAQMITSNSLMGRSAVKEVFKVYDIGTFNEINEITKYIPNEAEIMDDLQETNETSIIRWTLKNRAHRLEKWCQMGEDGNLTGDYAELFAKAIRIEGTKKSQGKHAAGVIISSRVLEEVCPMVRDKSGNPIAGFEMNALESLGHVKFDILGVQVLEKIIKILENSDFDHEYLYALDNTPTWDLLCNGDVKGIFQLERQKRWTKQLQPRNIHHLAALIAIIRPGVADIILDGKSMTKHYIDRKNGDEEVTYLFPCLEPILKKNYGIMIYQEEALRIASEIAGFDLKEADALRKAIGKKLVDKMAALKDKFIEGCVRMGTLNAEQARELFEWIEKSQKYLFNASHSYSYAVDAYYTAFCKANSRAQFYTTYLDSADGKQDKLEEIRALVNDAKLSDIFVFAPNLCNFNLNFSLDGNSIYFGVSKIKDVGATECKKLFKLFNELEDPCSMTWIEVLCNICDKTNKKAVEALVSVGAFNGPSNRVARSRMLFEYAAWKMLSPKEKKWVKENITPGTPFSNHLEELLKSGIVMKNRVKSVESILSTVLSPPYSLIDSEEKISNMESKYLGIGLTCFKTDAVDAEVNSTCKEIYTNTCRSGKQSIAVEILTYREHVIKNGQNKGETMCFLSVEDSSACLESVILFSEAYAQYKDLLFEGNTVIITGEPSRQRDGSFIVDSIVAIY